MAAWYSSIISAAPVEIEAGVVVFKRKLKRNLKNAAGEKL
jgi:hypothetical protein